MSPLNCNPCPRTPVTYVPGLYKGQGEGEKGCAGPLIDLTLSLSWPGEGTPPLPNKIIKDHQRLLRRKGR